MEWCGVNRVLVQVHPREASRRRSRRRLLASVGVLLAGALVLTGCGSSGATSGGGNGGTGTKEFTFWSMWTKNEPVAKVLQQAIASFQQQTGVKVHVQWEGRDSMTKLKAALNTDNVPDLIDQGFTSVAATLGSGQALDLTSVYAMKTGDDGSGATIRQEVPTGYDHLDTTNNKLILVPYYVSADTWWFNENAYPDLVSSPPTTWSQFTSFVDSVKAQGQNPIAQDSDILFYDGSLVYGALERALGPGNLHKLAADHSGNAWDDPKVKTAIDAIASLASGHDFIPGYDASKYPAMEKDWAHGKAALLYMGSWVPYYDGPDAGKNFKLGTFNFPTLGSNDHSVPTSTFGFAIPTKAKNGPAAKKFIAYMMSKKWLTELSQQAQVLTPNSDIPVPDSLKALQAVLKDNPVYPDHDNVDADYPNLDQRFQPLFRDLVTGKLSASAFIAQAKSVQQQYWKLNG